MNTNLNRSTVVNACKSIVQSEEMLRQTGRTTLLARAISLVNRLGSKFKMVCWCVSHRKIVEQEHGIPTISLGELGASKLLGTTVDPMLYDNCAVYMIAQEVVKMDKELRKLENKYKTTPMTVIKVESKDGEPVTPQDLEAWRDAFEAGQGDEDFKIFAHAGIEVKQIEVYPDFQVITDGE